jgi:hypothetical protein
MTAIAEAGVVVIGHPTIQEIEVKEIKKVFLGKTREVAGKSYVAVEQLEGSAIRLQFLEKVLEQSPEENKAHWTDQIFSGQGTPPKRLDNDAAVKAFVAENANAIGYIDESSLDASVKALNRISRVETSSLQAAYVYNFMLLSKWPDNQVKPNRLLCIAGQNRESLGLKSLEGRVIEDERIAVTSITNESELTPCDALFVASTEYSHFLDLAQSKPILVLSNIQPDNGRVSAIVLTTIGNKVVFDVDVSALTKSNIYLGASVLRLARKIKE